LAQILEAGLVDAADHFGGLALRRARRLELARPIDRAAVAVIAAVDVDRGVVFRHRQRPLQDRVAVAARAIVLAVETLDDDAAAMQRQLAQCRRAFLVLLALGDGRMPAREIFEAADRIPHAAGGDRQAGRQMYSGHGTSLLLS